MLKFLTSPQACQVETDPDRVRSYVMFLAQYGIETSQPTLNELVQVSTFVIINILIYSSVIRF